MRKTKKNPLQACMFSNSCKIQLMYVHLFIVKSEVARMITITPNCLVRVLMRNYISYPYSCVAFRPSWWHPQQYIWRLLTRCNEEWLCHMPLAKEDQDNNVVFLFS